MWLRDCVDRALDRCEMLLWKLILLVTGITFAMKSIRWALDRLRAKNPILRFLLEPCSAGLDHLEAGLKAAAPIPRSERQAERKVDSKPGLLAWWLKWLDSWWCWLRTPGATVRYRYEETTGRDASRNRREAGILEDLEHRSVAKPTIISNCWRRVVARWPNNTSTLEQTIRTKSTTKSGFQLLGYDRQLEIMLHLARAFKFIHSRAGIAHLAVSAENVLLVRDDKGSVQLSMFADAKDINTDTGFANLTRNDITSKMHPKSGTDPKSAGVRDDLWAFFMIAASMLSPTDPVKLLEEQWNRLDPKTKKEVKADVRKKLNLSIFQSTPQDAAFLHAVVKGHLRLNEVLSFSAVEELFKSSAITIPDTYLSWLREGLNPNGRVYANAAPCTWDTIITRLRIFESAEKEDKRRRQQQAKVDVAELKQLKKDAAEIRQLRERVRQADEQAAADACKIAALEAQVAAVASKFAEHEGLVKELLQQHHMLGAKVMAMEKGRSIHLTACAQ